MSLAKDRASMRSNRGRFGILLISMVSSAAFLFIMRAIAERPHSPVPYWSSIVAALLPLFWYHNYLAKLSKKGLSQTEIDSVYYFGFLITVMALGASALSMVHTSTELNLSPAPIITQFGVGLFATGYAVIARMHLSSLSGQDGNPEDALNDYVVKSREMIDNLDITLGRFENLARKSESAETALGDVSAKILSAHSSALERITTSFAETMSAALAETKANIADMRAIISDPAIATERKAFVKNIKAVSDSTTNLKLAASGLREEFERIRSASEAVAEQAGRSAVHTRELADAAQLVTKSLSEVSEGLAVTSAGAGTLGGAFAKAASDLGTATETIRKLTVQSSEVLEGSVQRSSEALASAVKSATDAATLLTSKLVTVADIIIEETQKKQKAE